MKIVSKEIRQLCNVHTSFFFSRANYSNDSTVRGGNYVGIVRKIKNEGGFCHI